MVKVSAYGANVDASGKELLTAVGISLTIVGGILLLAYWLLKQTGKNLSDLFGFTKGWEKPTGQIAIESAGLKVQETDGVTYATSTSSSGVSTTYKIRPEEWQQLNWAQRRLIELDKIVPGSALTRAVLG